MTFDRRNAATELDANIETIRSYLDDDDDLIERYRAAFMEISARTADEIRESLSSAYPGALPTRMLDETDSIIHGHPESGSWESHEAVNDWAREVLRAVPMLAVDGSEIPPTTQFNVPVAYIQAAWCLNYHVPEGRLERGLSEQLLSPEDVSRKTDDGDYRFVDSSLAGHHRYEHEGDLLVERMEHLAKARDAGDLERPPVVLYDGPLVVAFVTPLDEATRQRYIDTISRIIAASQHLAIPLVGYVAGTDARDMVKMVRNLQNNSLDEDPVVPDARVFAGLTGQWGDRTTPFVCRRNWSVDTLEGTYRDETYDFSEDLLFSYLNIPPGRGLDRIEFPGWLIREDGPDGYATMYHYTIEMVRAEAAVGRGYPEILQQADSDAVLDQHDRKQFLRLLQNWAKENNISLEWDAKALSKELRRR